MDCAALLDELFTKWREVWLLSTTTTVLEWDEDTAMPALAAAHRSEQLAMVAGLMHDRLVDPRLEELVHALDDPHDGAHKSGTSDVAALHARSIRGLVERHHRLPRALVVDEMKAAVAAQQAWLFARDDGSFRSGSYDVALGTVVDLKREVSRCLTDDGRDPWECLLREHEPGADAGDVVRILDRLAAELGPRVHRSSTTTAAHPLRVPITAADRTAIVDACSELFGYDRERGGFGHTAHPFCTTLGPDDVRIALRDVDRTLGDLVGYLIHEIGHALYEQGIPRELHGTPGAELRSLSLHESQSRLWEIQVGRSRALWTHLLPLFARIIPSLSSARLDDVVASLHTVEPGLIRVGADPVSYNLHIVVRTALERALVAGTLPVDDLPDAWAKLYEEHLGCRPQNDREGVLQDGHWASGMFGYFPTYTIGNLAAAQLMAAARRDVVDLDTCMARGDTRPLRTWLVQHVHARAGLASLDTVMRDATGSPLGVEAFLTHVDDR